MNLIIIIYLTFVFVKSIMQWNQKSIRMVMFMKEIFEFIMLACFGLSWPISVYKSITSKSTQGKSVVFITAIILGYISGIIGKIISNQINYVLVIYCFNLIVVSIDLVLYFINKHNENQSINRAHITESHTHRKQFSVAVHN